MTMKPSLAASSFHAYAQKFFKLGNFPYQAASELWLVFKHDTVGGNTLEP